MKKDSTSQDLDKEIEVVKKIQFNEQFKISTVFIDVTEDLTKKKITENSFNESCELNNSITQSSSDAIIVINSRGLIMSWNKASEKIFGYTSSEMINKSLERILPHEYRSGHKNAINRLENGAKETLIGKMIEIVALRKDGTEFPVELSLSSWKNKEGQTYFTGIIRDITEKKLALENLTLSEERLSQIIEVSKDWIWEVNTKGLYTYTSGIVEEMLGYKSNEIVNNKYFYDFFPEEKREKLKKIIFEAFKQKKIFHNFINSSISKSGGIVWFSMSGIPILDSKGDLIGYRGANCDITKCVNSEKALLEAKEKAEESANLKREFIRNLSHEIRTPMNGILGFSELLNDSDLTKEKQSEYVEIIQNSSTQLLHVIDDLLEISILDTNQLKKQEGKVNLNKLLEELFSVFQLKNKNNKVSFCIKKGLPNKQSILLTDKKILKKVLGILIENAFKFTQKGFVELGYQLRGDKIELYVKDSGIGINKENYDLIFELFSQEEKELSQKVGGLGLGLSIAKKSIQLLGGDIRVASEKGKGATFFVTVKRT